MDLVFEVEFRSLLKQHWTKYPAGIPIVQIQTLFRETLGKDIDLKSNLIVSKNNMTALVIICWSGFVSELNFPSMEALCRGLSESGLVNLKIDGTGGKYVDVIALQDDLRLEFIKERMEAETKPPGPDQVFLFNAHASPVVHESMFVGPGEEFTIQTVPSEVLAKRDYLELLICEYLTVDKFYFQLKSKALEMEELMDGLEQYYTNQKTQKLALNFVRKDMEGKL